MQKKDSPSLHAKQKKSPKSLDPKQKQPKPIPKKPKKPKSNATKLKKPQPISRKNELFQLQKQNQNHFACVGCGKVFLRDQATIDHIIPKKDFGPDGKNQILMCKPCNRSKGHTLTISGLHDLNQKKNTMKNLELAQRTLRKVMQAK